MTGQPQNYLLLICMHCQSSYRVRRGDLPEQCPSCKRWSKWRVAIEGEFTKSDERLLKLLQISSDDEEPST